MFQGFQSETIDFLWGIRLNNQRSWFEEHKQQYLDTLYTPMKELAQAVAEPFEQVPGLRCRVSRIYRDARLAPATPYKESLWFNLRRDSDSWSQHPCLYFELKPDEYSCGFILWAPKAESMQRFRERLDENPEPFLKLAEDLRRTTGLSISGRQYVRKKPCAHPEAAEYYNLKQIVASYQLPLDQRLYEPELADWVRKILLGCLPLNEFCQQFAG